MNETTSLRSKKPIWMQRHIWAFALLSAICVAGPPLGVTDAPTISAAVFLATVAALCSSMGFWLGFGESVIRFAAIPVGLCLVTLLTCIAFDNAGQFVLGIFCVMSAILVGAPLAMVRMVRRGRLRLSNPTNADMNSREVLRFNIWQVLVFTTAVGALLAIGKSTLGSVTIRHGGGYFRIGVAGANLGICSVVVVWATLGKQPLVRNLASCIVAGGLSVLNSYFVGVGHSIWIALTMIVWLEMTILMWLVRSEGYRFVVVSESQFSGDST